MLSLISVVKLYFPKSKILKISRVKRVETYHSGFKNLSLGWFGWSKQFYFKPMDMIETDEAYYFDRRQPYRFQSALSIFIGPLWMAGFIWLVSKIYNSYTIPLQFYLLVVALGVVVGLLNLVTNFGLVNIFIIKKESVKEVLAEGEYTVLKGVLTPNDSWTILTFLNESHVKNLGLMDKFYQFLNNLSSIFRHAPLESKFEIKFKEV